MAVLVLDFDTMIINCGNLKHWPLMVLSMAGLCQELTLWISKRVYQRYRLLWVAMRWFGSSTVLTVHRYAVCSSKQAANEQICLATVVILLFQQHLAARIKDLLPSMKSKQQLVRQGMMQLDGCKRVTQSYTIRQNCRIAADCSRTGDLASKASKGSCGLKCY